MRTPIIDPFVGGWQFESGIRAWDANMHIYVGPQTQLNQDGTPLGDALRQQAGTPQFTLRAPSISRDLLGTGNTIQLVNSTDGVPMLRMSGVTGMDTYGKWIACSAAAGLAGQQAFVTNPTTSITGTTHTPTSDPPPANFIGFICLDIPQGATWDNGVDRVGIDIGGFNYDPNPGTTVTNAIGVAMGDLEAGVTESWNGTGDVWTGAAPATQWNAIDTNNKYGRICRMFSVNGTSPGHCATFMSSGVQDGITGSVSNSAGTTSWTTPWATNEPVMVNLGQNVPGLGVYGVGIRKYAAAIPQGEVERACRFMAVTGKLPPWWIT